MSRAWFSQSLETVATFWRVMRRDGVTLGFTTHDRDLWFSGIRHLSAPGMTPSAIQRSTDLQADSAEVQGALDHGAIRAADLAEGRFDAARIVIGLVDWQTLEEQLLYVGRIGDISQNGDAFSAELVSRKHVFDEGFVPRTSPTCRAEFCGPGCNQSRARFEHEVAVVALDADGGRVRIDWLGDSALLAFGDLRWADGARAGVRCEILRGEDDWLWLDAMELPSDATRAIVIEGCDGTIATCSGRFGNALNFQGEPHLPGNDLLTRYPDAT